MPQPTLLGATINVGYSIQEHAEMQGNGLDLAGLCQSELQMGLVRLNFLQ